jgi:hypothetical protein
MRRVAFALCAPLVTAMLGCAAERATGPRATLAPVRVVTGQRCLPGGPCSRWHPALIVLDGRRYAEPAATAALARLRPEQIADLYVYRGPAAVAQFGAGTEAGVVVIVTKGSPAS